MSQNGYVNFLKDLNENDLCILQSDFHGRNPLHIAARENNTDLMNFLLQLKDGIYYNFFK